MLPASAHVWAADIDPWRRPRRWERELILPAWRATLCDPSGQSKRTL